MVDFEDAGGARNRDARRRPRRKPKDVVEGRLRAHDPFELIRWLALSQPDPRKALSELVQNSLDAGARSIRITRVREKGVPCLRILDDGEGVIPEMDRREALEYIATHVGHSRKRSLSPQERLQLLTQGQYGIGLLGFWSLGATLEMRTVVPGQRPHRLVLHRDKPGFKIEPLRGRLPLAERWTEILVLGLHAEAMQALVARRAADYLASELRGQLLARDVELLIDDRISRGLAKKLVTVRPPRFLGERLEGLSAVEVPGHAPIRLEIYVSGISAEGEEARGLAVYSSGTLVAEGFHDLAALALDRAPWTDARLTGLVDFPDLTVAPGSRRGIVSDEAAGAFAKALASIEPTVTGVLESIERRREQELDRTLVRDLQRAFRDFYRNRPRYSMLPVKQEKAGASSRGEGEGGSGPASGAAAAGHAEGPAASEDEAAGEAPLTPPPDLLPPGPLAEVRIVPSPVRIACGAAKLVRSQALDAAGRAVNDPVSFQWSLDPSIGAVSVRDDAPGRATVIAGAEPRSGSLRVVARSEGREIATSADIDVLEELSGGRSGEGIPEPEFVHEPGASWRSRMLDARWQVNGGHREYRAIVDRPALKLRYLAMLFAKEIVLQNTQDPRFERPLEQLIEVASYADRRLSEKRGLRRGRPAADE